MSDPLDQPDSDDTDDTETLLHPGGLSDDDRDTTVADHPTRQPVPASVHPAPAPVTDPTGDPETAAALIDRAHSQDRRLPAVEDEPVVERVLAPPELDYGLDF